MELLGPNLGDLLRFCEGKFSLRTSLILIEQMISRIEHIHNKHFVHRDLKPENMTIGTGRKSNVVYVIDFGLSKCFKTKGVGSHIPYRDTHLLVGTARFASINAHFGTELSRRDDLESLAYTIEFRKYLAYIRELKFEQKPDYLYLKNLFVELFYRKKYAVDGFFDWTLKYKKDSRRRKVNAKEVL